MKVKTHGRIFEKSLNVIEAASKIEPSVFSEDERKGIIEHLLSYLSGAYDEFLENVVVACLSGLSTRFLEMDVYLKSSMPSLDHRIQEKLYSHVVRDVGWLEEVMSKQEFELAAKMVPNIVFREDF